MSLADLLKTKKKGRGTHTMTSRTLEVGEAPNIAQDAPTPPVPQGVAAVVDGGAEVAPSGWKAVTTDERQRMEQEALLKADGGGDGRGDTLREQLFRKERKLRHLLFVGANEGRTLRSAVMPYSGPRYANTNRLCLRSWSVVSRPNLDINYYFPPEIQPLQPGEGDLGGGHFGGGEEEQQQHQDPNSGVVSSAAPEGKKGDTPSAPSSPVAPSVTGSSSNLTAAAATNGEGEDEAPAYQGPTYILAPPASSGYENPYEEPLLPEPYHFSSYDGLFEYLQGELLDLWNLEDVAAASVNISIQFGMCCLAASNMLRFQHLGFDLPSLLRKVEGENLISNYFFPDTHPVLRRAVKEIDFDQRTLKPEHKVQLSVYSKERNNYVVVNAKIFLISRDEHGKKFGFELQTLETAGVRSVWTVVGLPEMAEEEDSESDYDSQDEHCQESGSETTVTEEDEDDEEEDETSSDKSDSDIDDDDKKESISVSDEEKEERKKEKKRKSRKDDDRRTDAGASTVAGRSTISRRTRGGKSHATGVTGVTGITRNTERQRSGGRDKPFTERRCDGWMAKKGREPYQHGMPFELTFHCNGEKSLANPCVPFAKCVLQALAEHFDKLSDLLLPAVDLSNPPQEGELDKALQEPTPEVLSPVPDVGQVTAQGVANFIGSTVRPAFVKLVNIYDEKVKAEIAEQQILEEQELEVRRLALEEEARLAAENGTGEDEPIIEEKIEEVAEEEDTSANKPWVRRGAGDRTKGMDAHPTGPLPLNVLTGLGISRDTFETTGYSINKIRIETVYANKVRGIFVDECTSNVFDYSQTTRQVQAPSALGGEDGLGGGVDEDAATMATTFMSEPQLELLPRNIMFLREVKIRWPIEGFKSNEANMESFPMVGSLVKYLIRQSKEKRDADIRLSRAHYHERKQADASETGSFYDDDSVAGDGEERVLSDPNAGAPIVGSRRGGGGDRGDRGGRGAGGKEKKQSPYEQYDAEPITHGGSYAPGGRAGFGSGRGANRGARGGGRGRGSRRYYDDEDYEYDQPSSPPTSSRGNRKRDDNNNNNSRESSHRRYEPGRMSNRRDDDRGDYRTSRPSSSQGSSSSSSKRRSEKYSRGDNDEAYQEASDSDDGETNFDTRSHRSYNSSVTSKSSSSRNSSGRKVYNRPQSASSTRSEASASSSRRGETKPHSNRGGDDEDRSSTRRRRDDDRDRRESDRRSDRGGDDKQQRRTTTSRRSSTSDGGKSEERKKEKKNSDSRSSSSSTANKKTHSTSKKSE